MGRQRLTAKRLWMVVPALVVLGDPYLIAKRQPTLSRQFRDWEAHSRPHHLALFVISAYLFGHLNGLIPERYDPLASLTRSIESRIK